MNTTDCLKLQRQATERFRRSMDAIRVVWDLENPGTEFPTVVAPEANGSPKRSGRVMRSSNARKAGKEGRMTRKALRLAIAEMVRTKPEFSAPDLREEVIKQGVSRKESSRVHTHLSQLLTTGELRRTSKTVPGPAGKGLRVYAVNVSKFRPYEGD